MILIEQNPLKAVFMVPIASSQELVGAIMKQYVLNDITIEEDEIGSVVERIYNDRQVKP